MRHTRSIPAAISGLLLFASLTQAQMMAPAQGTPRISHIMPLGGQAGTTFELKITGQALDGVESLHFSFPGAKAEVMGSATTPGDKKKGKPAPALKSHQFKVTLPANAPLGIQDVRIVTKAGISNPRAFVVSDHKEYAEAEPNDDVAKAQRIELNSSVSGVISAPTDVDYYAFTGKKGQRVLCSCLSTSIDSRLPAALQLYSADGSYLGSNRNYFKDDALLDAVLPADGEYYVRVFSFSYTQGGIEYFYRLSVSTAPWIDAVFPPVVEPGKETKVTVYGRNLPGGKIDPDSAVNDRPLETVVVTVKASAEPKALQRLAYTGFMTPISSMLDGFDYRVKNDAGQSNPFLLTYANAPVVLDTGDNDEQAKAQQIPVPCVIAGRIEKKADRDWYAFRAKKGQVLNIEAFAERHGAPMDLFFQVRNAQGNLLAEQDDTLEVLSPQFYTANTDPLRYRFVAPADETYYLMVTSRDAFTQFGPRHLYTVHVTPEEPDFRLVAMPTSPTAPEGTVVNQAGGAAFTVFVWRFGGFNEQITLSGENLPPGLGVRPQIISGALKQAVVVVHAEPDAKLWAGAINLVGTATVKGKKLTRELRSATITWPVAQANVPTITRLDRELVLAVRDKAPYSLVVGTQQINVPQGQKISIPVKLVANGAFKTNVQVAAIGGPTGLVPQPLTLTPGQGGTVTLDAKGGQGFAPGNYTIFLRGQTQPINPKQPAPKGNTPTNYVQVSMPVSVTIVPKTLAKVAAVPQAAKVKVGKDVEVLVRVARTVDLPSSFKVEAIIPPNVKGLSAKEVTITAGEDEMKMIFTAAPNAAVGQSPTITLRFTAMFNGTIPVVHETKLTLSITK
jgi:hypothetical protein